MGKYSNIDDLIFSIFASSTWKAEKIQTFPSNFVKTKSLEEYIRVSIISSGLGVNFRSVSGELIIDIFSKSGTGPKQSSEIADKLDNYLSGKTIILLNGNHKNILTYSLYYFLSSLFYLSFQYFISGSNISTTPRIA